MALGINSFAEVMLYDLWEFEELDLSKISKSETYASEDKFISPAVKYALKLRTVLFKDKLTRDLGADYGLYKSNYSDFLLYLLEYMKKYLPYPCMSIFDKLLMSCVVVTRMAGICLENNNNIYQYVGPESLAMYFKQEHGNEFFEAGGWKKLQEYAEKYYDFEADLRYMNGLDDDLKKVKKGLDIISKTCNMDDILKIFKQRTESYDDKYCCYNCFPLFDVLNSLTRKSVIRVGDLQLVEGYLQLFHRVDMVSRRRSCNAIIEEARIDGSRRVGVDVQCKTAYTKILLKNIFLSLNEDGTWKPLGDTCCLLCGEDINVKSVLYTKTIFRRAAFEVKDKEMADNILVKKFLTLDMRRDQD